MPFQMQNQIYHIPTVIMKHHRIMKLYQKIKIMSNLKNLKLIDAIRYSHPNNYETATIRKRKEQSSYLLRYEIK